MIGACRLRKKSRPLRPIAMSSIGLSELLSNKRLRGFGQVGIESAAQSFVSSDQDQQITLIAAQIEQRMMEIFIRSFREFA